jgi:pilus assembly protein CpaE
MTPTGAPTKVLAIVDPGNVLQQITSAIGAQNEFTLSVETIPATGQTDLLVRQLQSEPVDMILIDHQVAGQPTLDILDDLALQFPDTDIIAILPESDSMRAQQVTLAGARAFLIQPFTQVNLLSTLRRVRDLQARRRQIQSVQDLGLGEGQKPQRTFVVISPRGGAGTSTVAANLAIALAEDTQARILLVEGKLFFGHLDVMLNIRSRNSLADLIPHATALDDILVREVVTGHISGIDVLLAPSDIQAAQGIRPQEIFNVINNLQRLYDFVVIDAGSSINDNTVTMMDAAGRILLVTNPDLATLHDVSRFMRISQSLAYPADKILLVLNRSEMDGGVKARDIEVVLHQRIFAEIANDPANALRCVNRGIPLVLNYPRSPASKSIKILAEKLVQLTRDASRSTSEASPTRTA